MEIIFNCFIGVVMLIYFMSALLLSNRTITGDILGVRGYPLFISVIGILLLIIITINAIRNSKKLIKNIPSFNMILLSYKRLILCIIAISVYILIMNIIGYFISTIMFVFTSIKVMGYKKTLLMILFAILLSSALILIFGKVFFVQLPRGIGIFRALSYLLY